MQDLDRASSCWVWDLHIESRLIGVLEMTCDLRDSRVVYVQVNFLIK